MGIATTLTDARRPLLRHLPQLALALALLALILLGIGPLGWRAGWWHYRLALATMMPWAAYCGLAAMATAIAALGLGGQLRWRRITAAGLAFALGAGIAYVPWHYDRLRYAFPHIHDITTDPDNPPAFIAVVPLRGKGDNPVAYGGPKLAGEQRKAWPDIAPLIFPMPPEAAFKLALTTVRKMGWTTVAADPAGGHIEASARSRWFGFTDDIAIRVAAAETGSRIDLRSASRLGTGDFGVNAARVRAYLSALRKAAGTSS